MLRQADLLSYLPSFMQEYREIAAVLNAENPEFDLILKRAENALDNEYITTADETGIKRFEKLLGLLPEEDDTIESRRAKVLALWFVSLPYTMRMLIKRLTLMCGADGFTVETDFEGYGISVITHFRVYSQLLKLRAMLQEMIPANMVIGSGNVVIVHADDPADICTGIRHVTSRKRIKAVIENGSLVRIDGSADIYGGIRSTGRHKKMTTEVKNYGVE